MLSTPPPPTSCKSISLEVSARFLKSKCPWLLLESVKFTPLTLIFCSQGRFHINVFSRLSALHSPSQLGKGRGIGVGTGVGTAAVAAWVHRSSSLQRAKFSLLLVFLHFPLPISPLRAEQRAQVPGCSPILPGSEAERYSPVQSAFK